MSLTFHVPCTACTTDHVIDDLHDPITGPRAIHVKKGVNLTREYHTRDSAKHVCISAIWDEHKYFFFRGKRKWGRGREREMKMWWDIG